MSFSKLLQLQLRNRIDCIILSSFMLLLCGLGTAQLNAQFFDEQMLPDIPEHELEFFADINPLDHPGFGRWTAALGDINGDGYDDLAVSSLSDTTFIFLGGSPFDHIPDLTVLGGANGLAAGDYNGDGRMDLATSTYTKGENRDSLWQGRVRVYLHTGTWPAYPDAPDRTIRGEKPYSGVGWAHSQWHPGVFSANIDGDIVGVDELLFTKTEQDSTVKNRINMILGGPDFVSNPVHFTFMSQRPPVRGTTYGEEYMIGDLNGDGCEDLCIHGSYTSQNRYRAYLDTWLGNLSATFDKPDIVTSDQEWFLDRERSNISDVNGDGCSDIIDTHSAYFAGAKLFLSSPTLTRIFVNDSIPNQDAAFSVGPSLICPVGDMSGDGRADLIIGWSTLVYPTGMLYFLYPSGPESNWKLATGYRGLLPDRDEIKHGAYPAGDLDGDGFDEIVFCGFPTRVTEARKDAHVLIYAGSPRLTAVEDTPPLPDGLSLSVYPQPARSGSLFTAVVHSPHEDTGQLVLTDMLGRKAYETDITLRCGQNRIPIPTSRLPVGTYMLRLHMTSGGETNATIILL